MFNLANNDGSSKENKIQNSFHSSDKQKLTRLRTFGSGESMRKGLNDMFQVRVAITIDPLGKVI